MIKFRILKIWLEYVIILFIITFPNEPLPSTFINEKSDKDTLGKLAGRDTNDEEVATPSSCSFFEELAVFAFSKQSNKN